MADDIPQFASPKRITPIRLTNVSNAKDENPSSSKKGKPASRSKNLKASDNSEKINTKRLTTEIEVPDKGDNPSSNNDSLSLTLVNEIRNLCASVGDMKKIVQDSVSTMAVKVDNLTNYPESDGYTYDYDDSDCEIESGQRQSRVRTQPGTGTSKVNAINIESIDPAQKLMDNILSEDDDRQLNINSVTEEFDILDSLKNNLSVDENVGENVGEKLAEIVTSAFTFQNKPENDITIEKLKKYKRPGNCPSLKTQEINKLMWDSVNSDCRTADIRMQRIQTSVIKASIAITECLNLIMKNKSEMPKKTTSTLVEKLGDAIALNSNAVREIILRRKHLIQPHLKEEYKPLCAPGAPVSFDKLMGDDLAKSMKDVSVASRLANKARKPQYSSNNRQYNYNQNRYHPYNNGSYNHNNFRGGFRHRRGQTPFLYRGRNNNKPPEKKGGGKTQYTN
ncbi:hypothetical protein SNE40_005965 [Patella caerulea]|uniref:Uncharacterized protein n=1 Tax=Patella caerulea TaxID=87958 RepID=A0AAN8K2C2_PATCE